MQHSAHLEKSLQNADSALQQRDFEHAAQYVAYALNLSPLSREVLDILDNIIAEAPIPEELISLHDNSNFGEVITHAYVSAKRGNFSDAISLVLDELEKHPDVEIEKWLPGWIADARFRNHDIDLAHILDFLVTLMADTNGRLRLRPTEAAFCRRFSSLALTLVKFYPEKENVLLVAANLLQRAGLPNEAIRYAADATRKKSDASGLHSLAMTLRASGEFNRAANGFEQVYKLAKQSSAIVDIARTRWDAGGLKVAFKLLKRAIKKDKSLEKDPEINCMLRYLNGDKELQKVLGSSAKPDDFRCLTIPLCGYLMSASDTSLRYIENTNHADLLGSTLNIITNCIEAPSVRLAHCLATTGQHDLLLVEYRFHEIPLTDPRRSDDNPGFLAWKYDTSGKIPLQAVPPVILGVQAMVLRIAEQAYYLPRWWNQARQCMKNNPVNLADLIAPMVYPAPAPAGFRISDWIRHQQIAAALLIAAAETQWENSLRRELLLDLLHGPIDWVTDAVLIALTEVALENPDALGEISYEFERLFQRVPEMGHWSLYAYLPLNYRRLPGRSKIMRMEMRKLLADYTASAASGSESN